MGEKCSVNVTNFSTPSASNACTGSGSTVTINSSTLINGTYTVTYNLSGNNTATNATSTMNFSTGAGTFTTGTLSTAGSTTVTIVSIGVSGGCTKTVSSGNTFNFTVFDPPTAFAGNNSVACASSYTTSSATASNYSNLAWSAVLGTGTFTNGTSLVATYTPSAADLLTGTVTLRLTANANGTCTNATSNIVLVFISGANWIGVTSSDWNTASNWCGGIPTASTDVVVSSGAPNYPVYSSGTSTVNSITINNGATMSLNGGTVTGGNIALNGTGVLLVGSSGTLVMNNNQVSGTGSLTLNGTVTTTKTEGFNGSSTTCVVNTISLSLGSGSTVNYLSGSSQTITAANYGNLSNTGNGNRILASSGTIGVAGVFSPGTGNYTITGSTVSFNGATAQISNHRNPA